MRVGGPLTREVSGIEFVECGVDVVEIEEYERRDLLIGIDLDDVNDLRVERPRSLD